MKTIEEKATAYARENAHMGAALDTIARAYIAGANDALAGQWRRVDDELPPRGVDVLICTDKGR